VIIFFHAKIFFFTKSFFIVFYSFLKHGEEYFLKIIDNKPGIVVRHELFFNFSGIFKLFWAFLAILFGHIL